MSITDAPAEDDERLDLTLPQGTEGEILTFGDKSLRVLRRPIRTATITDMAYIERWRCSWPACSTKSSRPKCGASRSRSTTKSPTNSLEIFHVSHGKWETAAPIRTFVPYEGGRSILASYTCTPVVHFPLADLTPGTKTIGRTVAELGRRSTSHST